MKGRVAGLFAAYSGCIPSGVIFSEIHQIVFYFMVIDMRICPTPNI